MCQCMLNCHIAMAVEHAKHMHEDSASASFASSTPVHKGGFIPSFFHQTKYHHHQFQFLKKTSLLVPQNQLFPQIAMTSQALQPKASQPIKRKYAIETLTSFQASL